MKPSNQVAGKESGVMLSKHLARMAREVPGGLVLADADRRLTYRELASEVADRSLDWETLQGRSVALSFGSPVDEAVALLALETIRANAFLVGGTPVEASEGADPWDAVVSDLGVQTPVQNAANEGQRSAATSGGDGAAQELLPTDSALPQAESTGAVPRVVVRTSGTTGAPKDVLHTWETLARPVRIDARFRGKRWLSLYPLNRYAGLQVFVQAFLNGGGVAFASSRDPHAVVSAMMREAVEYASGTPSFWRSLLLFGPGEALRSVDLKQVTIGGEAVDQEILDRLRNTFPNARIVHIYATTELGRCFAVSDGKAGFPASYLETGLPDGVEIKVEGDELYVRSPNRMLGYRAGISAREKEEGWFATGDLVDVRGDRVYFRGREDDIVNIGGHKVAPAEIEQILRQVDGVQDIRVFGRKSSITGSLLCAEVVRVPGRSGDVVAEVRVFAERSLGEHQIPRIIKEVDQIVLSESGKVLRS